MQRLIAPAAVAFLIAVEPIAFAAETLVSLEGCEYRVRLPSPPVISQGRKVPSGSPTLGVSMIAELRGKVPSFRIECAAVGRMPPGTERYVREDLLTLMKNMKLNDVEQTFEQTHLGPVVRFVGVSTQGSLTFIVTGAVSLGERSMLNVIATEAARGYPSKMVTRVFNTIER